MAKTLDEAKIAGRADRKRLAVREKPYWRGIDPEVHLGYRKGKRGGNWLVRWRVDGAYKQQGLGTADDEIQTGTLDFEAAIRAARAVVEAHRTEAVASAGGILLTVQTAVEAYIVSCDARATARAGRDKRSDASMKLGRHVLGRSGYGGKKASSVPALAAVPLHMLSEADLLAWRAGLPESFKAATKQRLINDLKAALNAAYADNRSKLPTTLPAAIKYGLRAIESDGRAEQDIARENQYLSDAEVTALIKAASEIDAEEGWEGDLFRLVLVLAATGARMAQVKKLRVSDVQFETSRLMMPPSAKGRGSKSSRTPVPVGSDVLSALRPIVERRGGSEWLLERWRKKQVVGEIRWERDGRGAWQTASELVRPWKLIKARAGLPKAIPYGLRHSSILRALRANIPITLVASVHDTSVDMIEDHYGRHIADAMTEVMAKAVVPLVPVG